MASPQPPGAGSQGALRARNVAAVVAALRDGEELSQAEIVRQTGLSAGSVSSIVHDLCAQERITVSTRGRQRRVRLREPEGQVVGVDIGRSHLRLLLGDLAGHTLYESLISLSPGTGVPEAVDRTRQQIDQAVAAVGCPTPVGVCVGVAGPISPASGEILSPGLLPEWFNVDIVEAFHEAIGLPVIVENDANLGALAEAQRVGLAEDLVYIKMGTGIGAGIVLGGRLRRGVSNSAGEIGHLSLDPNGIVCRCGNRGCLETITAVPAILQGLGAWTVPVADIEDVVDHALAGDVSCIRVLGDAGTAIGMAAAIVCNVLNPDHIVIGGPIVRSGDVVLGPLVRSMRRYTVPASGNDARVTASVYGDSATAIGALALAREEFAGVA